MADGAGRLLEGYRIPKQSGHTFGHEEVWNQARVHSNLFTVEMERDHTGRKVAGVWGWTWDRFFHIVLNLSCFLLAIL